MININDCSPCFQYCLTFLFVLLLHPPVCLTFTQSKSRLDDGLGSLGVDSLDGLDLFDFPDDDDDDDKKRRPSNRPFSSNSPTSSSSSSSGLFSSPPRSSTSTSTSGKPSGGGVPVGGGGRNQAPAPKMEGI